VFWAEKYSEKLGSLGCTVKIDEAKISKRKYNYGIHKKPLDFQRI